MTLADARAEFIRWDRFAVQFPEIAAVQASRKKAYEDWLVAVRSWRISYG